MANPARIKLGLVAALCLALAALAFLIASPSFGDERAIRKALIERLTDWSGASVSINGPVSIQYFPRLLVETDDIRITGAKHLPAIDSIQARQMLVRLGLWSLVSAEPVIDRITFVKPEIKTSTPAADSNTPGAKDIGVLLFNAISKAPVDQIVLDQGKIILSNGDTPETVSEISVKMNLEPGGVHTVRGSATWREQPLAFTYEGGAPSKLDNTARMSVVLTVSSALVSADINGHATIRNDVHLGGDLSLQIPNLSQFARWTGVLVPQDQKRGVFSAEGTVHWSGHKIGFDEGSFTLDGNRALGALTLNFGSLRPKIDGTLALQRLDLTQYFESTLKASNAKPANPATAQNKAFELDFPVLHHINFDLRISTTDLVAGPFALGQTALSVSLDAGKLAADIAVFELCNGNGNSRILLDATVPNSEIKLSTSLSGIAARSCIEMFAATSPIEGTAEITADLTSSGRTVPQILDMLRGKASISIAAGSLAANFDNLLTQLNKQPVTGWGAVTGSSTAFKLLKGDIFLRPNAVYSDSLVMDLGTSKLMAEGTVDFASKSLDIQLERSEQAAQKEQGAQKEVTSAPLLHKKHFVIKGPWSEPNFTLGQRQSSAQRMPYRADVQTATRQAN